LHHDDDDDDDDDDRCRWRKLWARGRRTDRHAPGGLKGWRAAWAAAAAARLAEQNFKF
jgi:hypothetical protein